MTILPLNSHSIKEAVEILKKGQLVVLPTETVYGLAGDATNGKAVASIFAIKGRPQFNPLIAHVSSIKMAECYVEIDCLSRRLMEAFWPGPLTLVLPLKPHHNIHPLTTAGLNTLAVRFPDGGFAEIVQYFGRPLAAPSANQSGYLSPTSAASVFDSLGKKVSLIIDNGPTKIGLESTIIKVCDGNIYLLRPGGIIVEDIEKVAEKSLKRMDQCAAIEAPGMLKSHYAPNSLVRLNAQTVENGEALLAFGTQRIAGVENAIYVLNLSESGQLEEAAFNFFQYMKQLDLFKARCIAVEPIPFYGLGEAINDRLIRAAAPKGE
ncbi:Sua5/YciO/YrdC/YwlC family tRNA threonylcarbamoyl adenosine modification protein [Bartonella bacilliformis str. Heidi Mejia]|uniref:L-threonylcarbamoyladenylate synthase n=1 Tax=Bartonella bacilliformis TaxID=774 RepID=UPI0004477EE2|nr:L-threonylcarbamoyladenylate synthase [Bartonella bacilliformis]EYS92321.1 Sua5/YciO/YrdC/YwlC family tRNA threonylcarbamoyl adenosine modification protein [Bartonella bacilliformis str. Heidi Mejia]KEG16490.1 Sua5/YciO/YrdC/YwlC family protein [Bartonella bacilliformis Cond044]KEG18608.1 Sua5/YciO/YrdC/YwlC family protein [Bartonella bacilliformis Hosp800-02]KEG23716.1 Sua5/YciO/YrdC/YwlC family protein [Bartonella bacilliformis VAB9028]KEG24065.1 Sua5/YciO/YrdC/YwlC family protein [Barton